MKKRYRILPVEGIDGLEFLADSPVGRRIYRAGEIVELDDAVHNVAAIQAHGCIEEMADEVAPEPSKPVRAIADKEA